MVSSGNSEKARQVMHMSSGRWSDLNRTEEVSVLEPGMDFRRPEYRREVFHRMYQFTLKYRVHPGCVYFVLPDLQRELALEQEEYLWLCFLNGNTQHPITSWLIMEEFPTLRSTNPDKLNAWLKEHWQQLEFDMDRRYWKTKLADAVRCYKDVIGGGSQVSYFSRFCDLDGIVDEMVSFTKVWSAVREGFFGFGRLSTFSYLEYLRLAGIRIQPDSLLLEDMEGSKSHRNGLCKVLGRDDLDWHDSNPGFDGKYNPKVLKWLEDEALLLLAEAQFRAEGTDYEYDINYFTLESVFCTYKAMFRKNRRYPGCYADMFHDRIKKAESNWPDKDFDMFWKMRASLPKQLRLESNPRDVGLSPVKQNWFRDTGEVPMLDIDDPAFTNEYTSTFLEDE